MVVDFTFGLRDISEENNDLQIAEVSANQFMISFESENTQDPLDIYVISSSGQIVAYNKVYYNGSGYQYDLNMNYAAKGSYLIRLGDDSFFKSKKIIVK